MAPRKAAKEQHVEHDDAAAVESKRLLDRAMEQGVLSGTRSIVTTSLPPTKAMVKAGGKDIVKRGSSRKGRYLLVFNCQLAPAAAGRLGTLAALDTKNPVMYIDFPQGRLKLFGTLVFPRNKYVVLRLGVKEVVAEDVLESMIVFSEAWWVGTPEANPEELRLDMPAELASAKLHDKHEFSSRGGPSGAATTAGTGREEEEAEPEEPEEEEQPASQRPVRRATRAGGASKRQRYTEDSDASLPGSEDDEDVSDEEPAPRKLPRLGQRASLQRRSSKPEEIDLTDSSDDEPVAAAAPRKATPPVFFKPRARVKASEAASGEKDELLDLAGSSSSSDAEGEEEEEGATQGTQIARPRSTRKAAGVASKKLRVQGSSGSEEGEDDGDKNSSEEEDETSSDEASDYEPSD